LRVVDARVVFREYHSFRHCTRVLRRVARKGIAGTLLGVALAFSSHGAATAQGGKKIALLIGIDTYQPENTSVTLPSDAPAEGRWAGGLRFANLTGPEHDVAAIHEVLVSKKYGFLDENIHVLKGGDLTREGVLRAMQRYLVDEAQAEDTAVFYFSGHGSLRVNTGSQGVEFDVGGKPSPLENSLVAADAYLGADDIYSTDLRRIFNAAADKKVHLTAIIDACHSGSIGRRGAGNPKRVPRNALYDPRDLAPYEKDSADLKREAPESRTDHPVIVMSAAQKDELALDIEDETSPHGLFTNALVEALHALPADAPSTDVFRRTMLNMQLTGEADQQPALDSRTERKHEPLFGGAAAQAGGLRAMALRVDSKGVLLDVGLAMDIGVGSEFVGNGSPGDHTMLRVTQLVGATQSLAIIKPHGAAVRVKQIFDLNKWVPTPRSPLKFYAGPTLPSITIADALAVVRSIVAEAGAALVADPTAEAWTHHIIWTGNEWTLVTNPAAKNLKAQTRDLGTRLNANSLQGLTAQSVVWFDAPLPQELAASLLNDPQSSAQLTVKRTDSAYVAGSVPTANGFKYAWFARGLMDQGDRTPEGSGEGCSTNSPLPLRTDFTEILTGVPLNDQPAASLNERADRLVKLNAWLHLQNAIDANPFPYRLMLARVNSDGSKTVVQDGEGTHEGSQYQIALVGNPNNRAGARWIYVLGIDCQGNGAVIWPRRGPGGRYPADGGIRDQIRLEDWGDYPTPPFGTDTFILLTTGTQLADPTLLNFEGVVRDESTSRGATSPLEDLLSSASQGGRGNPVATPTEWSVKILQVHSTGSHNDPNHTTQP
jgi:hypothetical protein